MPVADIFFGLLDADAIFAARESFVNAWRLVPPRRR